MEPRGSSYFVLPNNCMLSDYRRISCGKLFTDIELYSIYAKTDSGTSISYKKETINLGVIAIKQQMQLNIYI